MISRVINLKILIAGLAAIGMVVGFTWHYMRLTNQVGNLAATVQQEKINHQQTQQSFEEFVLETQRSFADQQQVINDRTQAFRRYEEGLHELQAFYNRHDFAQLLEAKPGLTERRINDASQRVLKHLRSVTAFEGDINPGEADTSTSPSRN